MICLLVYNIFSDQKTSSIYAVVSLLFSKRKILPVHTVTQAQDDINKFAMRHTVYLSKMSMLIRYTLARQSR